MERLEPAVSRIADILPAAIGAGTAPARAAFNAATSPTQAADWAARQLFRQVTGK